MPDILPNRYYTFAIERNATGYTLEASGTFTRVGFKTLHFFRPFIVDANPFGIAMSRRVNTMDATTTFCNKTIGRFEVKPERISGQQDRAILIIL
jgi:hypothetical protein